VPLAAAGRPRPLPRRVFAAVLAFGYPSLDQPEMALS
jgi:hypothetical protein